MQTYDVVIYRQGSRDPLACVTFRAETPDGQADKDWMDACASGMAAYIGEIVPNEQLSGPGSSG